MPLGLGIASLGEESKSETTELKAYAQDDPNRNMLANEMDATACVQVFATATLGTRRNACLGASSTAPRSSFPPLELSFPTLTIFHTQGESTCLSLQVPFKPLCVQACGVYGASISLSAKVRFAPNRPVYRPKPSVRPPDRPSDRPTERR